MFRRGIVLLAFFVLPVSSASAAWPAGEFPPPRESFSVSILASLRSALAGLLPHPIGLFANHGIETDPDGRPLAPPQGTSPIGLFGNSGVETDPNGRPLSPPQGTSPGVPAQTYPH